MYDVWLTYWRESHKLGSMIKFDPKIVKWNLRSPRVYLWGW